ncbi:aspartate/glutamate racemase family protein [Nonomuraea sp. NPDC050643]|uniref:aspartate/glutamate racemase family protein n=1 Tax=Nonomuraea sp. NPDC050643 TaxID=3155660 RepID=UPI0033F17170
MLTIGLIGGLSWESTAIYYQTINSQTRKLLGRSHSARSLIWSFEFQEFEDMIFAGKWEEVSIRLSEAGSGLESLGADVALICSNTFHRIADTVADSLNIPLIHIADVVGREIVSHGMRKVGLLGTRFTMEQDFYVDRLARQGVEVIVPDKNDRELVDRVIFDELVRGVLNERSRQSYRRIIDELRLRGAEGVILGCTEIELLIGGGDVTLPVFPSARIHAESAVSFALERRLDAQLLV